jgi:hypothetical protein
MCWILLEALVVSKNFPFAFRRNLPIDRGKKERGGQRVLLLATLQQGGFPSRQSPWECWAITVTSQANGLWREEGPFVDHQDVTGVHGCVKGLLLSNTLKNKRLEQRSCTQEGNFIDKD